MADYQTALDKSQEALNLLNRKPPTQNLQKNT